MKYYVYKVLFFFLCLFLLFQFTIGIQIRSIKNKIENLGSKETSTKIKEKIREEIKDGLKKDRKTKLKYLPKLKKLITQIKLTLPIT